MEDAIHLTTKKVPISGDLQNACRIPLISVCQPFLPKKINKDDDLSLMNELSSEDIARCQGCLAYINHLCPFDKQGWICSLCGMQNDYSMYANRRYLGGEDARLKLPELHRGIVEASVPLADATSPHQKTTDDENSHYISDKTSQQQEEEEVPPLTCIALVDASSPDIHFLEVVKSSLLAGVEGLIPGTRFGIITFGGESLALYEPALKDPRNNNNNNKAITIRHIPLSTIDSMTNPTAVDLSLILPLDNLCSDVKNEKESIINTIEALSPLHTSSTTTTTTTTSYTGVADGRHRPFGEALQAVLRYLSTNNTNNNNYSLIGTRLLVFLSGAPNCGRGNILYESTLAHNNTSVIHKTAAYENTTMLDSRHPTEIPFPNIHPMESTRHTKKKTGWQHLFEKRRLNADAPRIKWQAEDFYTNAAAAAATLGITIDLYAAIPSSTFLGLEVFHSLAHATGGTALLYLIPRLHDDATHTLQPGSLHDTEEYDWDSCSMPADVYKRLSEPRALSCLLRIRMSPELCSDTTDQLHASRIGKYSHHNKYASTKLYPDAHYDDLYHIQCMHPHESFAMPLTYSSSRGFASKSTPVIQIVLQYLEAAVPAPSVVVSRSSGVNDNDNNDNKSTVKKQEGKKGKTGRAVLRKRIRIITKAFSLATTPLEVYQHIDIDCFIFSMTQHILDTVTRAGVDAARAGLVEMFAEVVAATHEWVIGGEYVQQQNVLPSGADTDTEEENTNKKIKKSVDPSFSAIESLQQLPRFIFAFLRGGILGDIFGNDNNATTTTTIHQSNQDHHPDMPCAMRMLWQTLPPHELSTAIYPRLSSWHSADELSFPRHSLSKAALSLSRQPLYLLDAYYCLVLYHTNYQHSSSSIATAHKSDNDVESILLPLTKKNDIDAAPSSPALIPFPPPHQSLIRNHISQIRHARQITPRVLFLKEGEGDASMIFSRYLIEDGDSAQNNNGISFAEFLSQIKDFVEERFSFS